MNGIAGTPGVLLDGSRRAAAEQDRLRGAIQQLEGVFVQQLFTAMRQTVPEGGLVDGGAGEEMFAGLLDGHLAAMVPGSWDDDGLEWAMMRQLRPGLQPAGDIAEPAEAPARGKARGPA